MSEVHNQPHPALRNALEVIIVRAQNVNTSDEEFRVFAKEISEQALDLANPKSTSQPQEE